MKIRQAVATEQDFKVKVDKVVKCIDDLFRKVTNPACPKLGDENDGGRNHNDIRGYPVVKPPPPIQGSEHEWGGLTIGEILQN